MHSKVYEERIFIETVKQVIDSIDEFKLITNNSFFKIEIMRL